MSSMLAACATTAPATPDTQEPTDAIAQATSAPTTPPAPTARPAATKALATALPPTSGPQPTTAPTSVPQPTTAPTSGSQPTSAPAASFGSELLFLRDGTLIAHDTQTSQERTLADNVRDFAATPDGSAIALIREVERVTELWTIKRDGSGLTQLTTNNNDRIEATPSWAPDGSALVFAASDSSDQYTREWPAWAQWCNASEVHLWDTAQQTDTKLADGCDPAFAPDGKRIAYAAPPTQIEPGLESVGPAIANSIRLINRQGENGWDFARANGPEAPAPNNGRLVYGPGWSPDSSLVVYHRFIGYQALVDINMTEIAPAFSGKAQPLGTGAGWMLPSHFSPDGQRITMPQNNYSDARGFGGYDNWSVEVVSTSGSRAIQLPAQTLNALGQRIDYLPRAQQAVWSPDGSSMAVQLPPGWNASMSPQEPLGIGDVAGDVWRWQPGNAPQQRLAENVDFASPLAWLPAQ